MDLKHKGVKMGYYEYEISKELKRIADSLERIAGCEKETLACLRESINTQKEQAEMQRKTFEIDQKVREKMVERTSLEISALQEKRKREAGAK